MGLVVDSVSDVQQFDLDNLQPAPDISASIDNQFILGLTTVFNSSSQQQADLSTGKKAKGRMVILIDIDKLASEGLIEQVSGGDHVIRGNG
jgi:purine-binding chemotaxis protein CheW